MMTIHGAKIYIESNFHSYLLTPCCRWQSWRREVSLNSSFTFLKLAVVLTKVQDDLVGNSVIFSYFLQAADQGFPTEMLVDFQKQVDYKVARCISEAIHCHGWPWYWLGWSGSCDVMWQPPLPLFSPHPLLHITTKNSCVVQLQQPAFVQEAQRPVHIQF